MRSCSVTSRTGGGDEHAAQYNNAAQTKTCRRKREAICISAVRRPISYGPGFSDLTQEGLMKLVLMLAAATAMVSQAHAFEVVNVQQLGIFMATQMAPAPADL